MKTTDGYKIMLRLHKNKKGEDDWTLAFIAIGLILIVFAFLYVLSVKLGKDTNLGDHQLYLFNTYNNGEKAQLYLEESAKLAAQKAIQETQKSGGLSTTNCEKYLDYSLYDPTMQNCVMKTTDSFNDVFMRELYSYLSENNMYQGYFRYEINTTKKNNKFYITGKSLSPLIIKNDTENKEKTPWYDLTKDAPKTISYSDCTYDEENLKKLENTEFSGCYKHHAIFKKYTDEIGVDPLLIYSLVLQESSCNSNIPGGIMQVDDPCLFKNTCTTVDIQIDEGFKEFRQNYDYAAKGVDEETAMTLTLFAYNRGKSVADKALTYFQQGQTLYDSMVKACNEKYDQPGNGCTLCHYTKAGQDKCIDPGLGAKYPERIFENYKKACTAVQGSYKGTQTQTPTPTQTTTTTPTQSQTATTQTPTTNTQTQTTDYSNMIYKINPSFNLPTDYDSSTFESVQPQIKALQLECNNSLNIKQCITEYVENNADKGWDFECEDNAKEVMANFYDQYYSCAKYTTDTDCLCEIGLETPQEIMGDYSFVIDKDSEGNTVFLLNGENYNVPVKIGRILNSQEYFLDGFDVTLSYTGRLSTATIDPDGIINPETREFTTNSKSYLYKNKQGQQFFLDEKELLRMKTNNPSLKQCSIQKYTTRFCISPPDCVNCEKTRVALTVNGVLKQETFLEQYTGVLSLFSLIQQEQELVLLPSESYLSGQEVQIPYRLNDQDAYSTYETVQEDIPSKQEIAPTIFTPDTIVEEPKEVVNEEKTVKPYYSVDIAVPSEKTEYACVYDSENLMKLEETKYSACYKYNELFTYYTPKEIDPLLIYAFAYEKSRCLITQQLVNQEEDTKPDYLGGIMKSTECYYSLAENADYKRCLQLTDTMNLVSNQNDRSYYSCFYQNRAQYKCLGVDAQIGEGVKEFVNTYNSVLNEMNQQENKDTLKTQFLNYLFFSYSVGLQVTKNAISISQQESDTYSSMLKACYETFKQDGYGCAYCRYDKNGVDKCSGDSKGMFLPEGVRYPVGVNYPEKVIKNYEEICSAVGGIMNKQPTLETSLPIIESFTVTPANGEEPLNVQLELRGKTILGKLQIDKNNDKNYETVCSFSPCQTSIENLAAGTHTFNAKITQEDGKTKETSITLFVESKEVIPLPQDPPQKQAPNPPIIKSFTANPPSGVEPLTAQLTVVGQGEKFVIEVDSNEGKDNYEVTCSSSPCTVNTVPSLKEGNHIFYAKIRDDQGRSQEATVSIIVTKKQETPTPTPATINNYEFLTKINEVSSNLKSDPLMLIAIMKFESNLNPQAVNYQKSKGDSTDPSVRCKYRATGLIQFMPNTAAGLKTTTCDLYKMTAVEQMVYVEKYFKPYTGKLNDVSDYYMVVLWPRAVGKSDDYVLWTSDKEAYKQNSRLDWNQDGQITKAEASNKVETYYAQLQTQPDPMS